MLRHPLLRKVGFFLLLFLGALLLGSVLTATLFEKPIGRRVLTGLNRQLKTRLEVKDFELSFFRHFPGLSANLRGVSLLDGEGGLLLQADRMAFSIGLLGFITSDYHLRSVSVSDGVLHLRWDEAGRPNYAVLQMEGPDTLENDPDETLSFSLREATLERVEFDMSYAPSHREAKGRIAFARFSGRFGPERFTLKSRANGRIGFIEADGQRFFINQPLTYEAEVSMDWAQGEYDIADLALEWQNSRLTARGNILREDPGLRYDVVLAGDDVDLDDVVNLLPASLQRGWAGYHASGQVSMQGALSGLAGPGDWPPIRIRLAMDRGSLSGPRLGEAIEDLTFVARYEAGGSRPFRVRLDSIRAYFGRELVEGYLLLEGARQPSLAFGLDGNLPVSGLYPMLADLLEHPHIEKGLGEIEIRNLEGRGQLILDEAEAALEDLQLNGRIRFDDAGLRIRGEDIRFDRGDLFIEEDRIRAEGLKLEGVGNELLISGQLLQGLPILLGKKALPEASFSLDLQASAMDLDRLLVLAPLAPEKGDSRERLDSLGRKRLARAKALTRDLRGVIDAQIKSLKFKDLELEDFTGELLLEPYRVMARGDLETMGGRASLSGSLYLEDAPRLEASLSASDILLQEAFRQARNFGQEQVLSENLRGRLQTRMIIRAFWKETGRFDLEKLQVQAGVGILDGELNRLKVLEQFADYVDIKDLRRIRFADLQHYIEVRNATVYLPVLFLRSNALNLSLSGLHRFDGKYRYNIKINAGQVLTDRFRKHDPSLQPRPARRKGFFNLYYRLQGDEADLRVEKARREVRDDFDRSRQRLRFVQSALEDAFGERLPIKEPEAWKDESSAEGGEDFLDFDLSGGGS